MTMIPLRRKLLLLLAFLLLMPPPPPPRADGLHLGQWARLLSLSHSLMVRVANARAARGDLDGADRARIIADNLRLLGSGPRAVLSAGWDFFSHYAWRGAIPTAEITSAAYDLLTALSDAARLSSGAERAAWALRNYAHVLRRADKLFRGLLRAFSQPGPLREAVLVIQKEVADGQLLRDCLEVGANDLEGLLQIAREMFFSAAQSDRDL